MQRAYSTRTPTTTPRAPRRAPSARRRARARRRGTNKLGNYTFAEYARLYPGFDGVAANGLKYGASLEIRQDQNSGAGGGQFGSISQQDRARAALYFRREWGYLGTNQLGTIRFGSIDQPTSLYMTGTFENFNDGGWNGDVNNLISSAIFPTWPFSDGSGSYYTTSKVVYLSPQLFGFDLGVSFEPSTANVGNFSGAGDGCGAGGYFGTNFVNPAGTFTSRERREQQRCGLCRMRPLVLLAEQRRVGAPQEHVRRADPLPRQLRPGRRRGDRCLYRRQPRARQPDRRRVQQQSARRPSSTTTTRG